MAIRYDQAKLSKVQRTANGGMRVRAVLTKTGIFEYKNADGSTRREYRPSAEVMKQDALGTFAGLPVTVGHPGLVTAANWKQHSVGHVGDEVKQQGTYVTGTLVIQDAPTCKLIEDGELKEVSCGYHVDLDETPGVVDGQRYDCVQRNIRGNHVAILPEGRGRAGRDVVMRLDSNGDCYTPWDMPDTDEEVINTKKVVIRTDGAAEIEKLQAQVTMLTDQLKEANARFDAANSDSVIEAKVNERVKLHQDAKDAGVDPTGKSPKEVKLAVILSKNPSFKQDGKSDEFVSAAYEMALSFPNAKLGGDRQPLPRADSNEDPVEKARLANIERGLKAHTTPLTVTRTN